MPEEEALLEYLRTDPRDLSREARIYEGALRAAADIANPDWMALAAHDIRELMNRLPYILLGRDLPDHQALVGRVTNLRRKHVGELARLKASGNLDSDSSFLSDVIELLEDFGSEFLIQRKAFTTAQRAAGVIPELLPDDLQTQVANKWRDLYGYFVNLCHHNKYDTSKDFRERMRSFARFALDRLAPPHKVVEDLDRLDAIIKRYE